MARPHVIIAGPMGAGKSTLTAVLAQKLGYTPFFESAGEGEDGNPFLARFYDTEQRRRWACASQTFFLAEAIAQQHEITQLPGGAIQDRSTFEHLGIFIANLHRSGMLDDAEHALLHKLAAAGTRSLPAPDLLVYLRATPKLLAERIRARGRPYELEMLDHDWDYMVGHCASYEQWIDRFDACSVITVQARDLDPDELAPVIEQLRSRLDGTVIPPLTPAGR